MTSFSFHQSVFSRLIGGVYIVAFCSMYIQWPGLLGPHGLLPVDIYVERVVRHFGTIGFDLVKDSGSVIPSLYLMGFDVFGICEALMLIGLCCSVALLVYPRSSILSLLCLVCYMSLIHVGQQFYSFQWDSLLLEVGFLFFLDNLLSRKSNKNHSNLSSYCYRFLAWKLMLLSGIVKFQSMCPTWKGLTALEYHFATQCIPSPLAWIFNQLPPIFLRFSVAMTLLIELHLTFFLIVPLRYVRIWGSIFQILLQIQILLTGNYNFFNILTIILMFPCFYDDYGTWNRKGKWFILDMGPFLSIQELFRRCNLFPASFLWQSVVVLIALYLSWNHCLTFDSIGFVPSLRNSVASFAIPSENISWSQNFSLYQSLWWRGDRLQWILSWSDIQSWIIPSSWFGVFLVIQSLFLSTVMELHRLFEPKEHHDHDHSEDHHSLAATNRGSTSYPKIKRSFMLSLKTSIGWNCMWIGLEFGILLLWIGASFSGFQSVFPGMNGPSSWLGRADSFSFLSSFPWGALLSSFFNSYGLFRVMTGVGPSTMMTWPSQSSSVVAWPIVQRPELILEGLFVPLNATDASAPQWQEIPFLYKPNLHSQKLQWNVPYQPRLDWQMWFAALSSYQSQPWIVHLGYHLLSLTEQDLNATSIAVRNVHHVSHWKNLVNRLISWMILDPEASIARVSTAIEMSSRSKSIQTIKGSSAVLQLLDLSRWKKQWGNQAPMAIRIQLYHLDFTRSWNVSWNHVPLMDSHSSTRDSASNFTVVSRDKEGLWHSTWIREYLPALDVNNPSLLQFLSAYGFPSIKHEKSGELLTSEEQCLKRMKKMMNNNNKKKKMSQEAWKLAIQEALCGLVRS